MRGRGRVAGKHIGSGPLGDVPRGPLEARTTLTFWCDRGHETERSFAIDVEMPEIWPCTCGRPAGLDREAPPAPYSHVPHRTHLQYVQSRRDEQTADVLLQDALDRWAANHGQPPCRLPDEVRAA